MPISSLNKDSGKNRQDKWYKLYTILLKILPPEEARLKAERIIERAKREILSYTKTL